MNRAIRQVQARRWFAEWTKAPDISLPCEPWEKPVQRVKIEKPANTPCSRAARFGGARSGATLWTEAEMQVVRDMRSNGHGPTHIARTLGRTVNAVKHKIRQVEAEGLRK
jgi:DNA-binding NarL/FixJ family response regulator